MRYLYMRRATGPTARRTLAVLLLLVSCLTWAEGEASDEGEFIRGILAVGKFTGGCGIIKMMLQFQENTQMEGGDDFIYRFYTAESARVGMSLDEYADSCKKAIEKYEMFWAVAGPDEK